jgi:16S rRNA (cytosine1402-N4)-methyltransferase
MTEQLARRGITQVAGVLLDLGVSSPQLEEAERGFSFAADGPLDMRMDTSRGRSAAEWLNSASEEELREVILRHGEERFAKAVAASIIDARRVEPLRTTRQLAAVVARAVRTREPGQHPATRTFQAVRIHVNQELEELEVTLPQAERLLQPGGRLAVISFHSLEDRIVKTFMRARSTGDTLPKGVPVRAKDIPPAPMRVIGKAVKPSSAEVARNPRSRSAVLRVAEKNPPPPLGGGGGRVGSWRA